MGMSEREPFGGRYWGIWNVEGDGDPVAIFPSKADASRELTRRQVIGCEDVDAEDGLDLYHHVFSCDIAGAWWNSHDPDPRAENPLTVAEIVAVAAGEEG